MGEIQQLYWAFIRIMELSLGFTKVQELVLRIYSN